MDVLTLKILSGSLAQPLILPKFTPAPCVVSYILIYGPAYSSPTEVLRIKILHPSKCIEPHLAL